MAEWKRSIRFPLPLPLRYRVSGTRDWYSGKTQNVSGSGVLFCADCELAVGTQLELRMAFEVGNKSYPGEILAQAEIVRIAVLQTWPAAPVAEGSQLTDYTHIRSRPAHYSRYDRHRDRDFHTLRRQRHTGDDERISFQFWKR